MSRQVSRRAFAGMAIGSSLMLAAGGLPIRRRRTSNGFEWHALAEQKAWATTNASTGGNVLVIGSRSEAMMVDAKFAGIVPLLRAEAEQRLDTGIGLLVNTHHHADHTGGNVGFTNDAEVLSHAAAARRVAQQLERYDQQLDTGEAAMDRLVGPDKPAHLAERLESLRALARSNAAKAFVPTTTIDRYPMRRRVGELSVELHHFGPGHTDNDVVVHVPELNLLHTGDLVFNGLHPFFDQSGGVSAAGWIRSLRMTRDLCNGATAVVPGHGPITDVSGIDRQIDYLERLMENVSRAIAQGRSRDETAAMRWEFMEGLGFEQIRPRAIAAVYDELSP